MYLEKTINWVIWIVQISVLTVPSTISKQEPEVDRRLYRTLREEYSQTDENREETSARYFEQILDHFNPVNEVKFSQRYWRNSKYRKDDGPAFLIIQGEGHGVVDWVLGGQWVSYAEAFNADIFSLEHRFYGNSVPKNDTTVQNLIHLNSGQAIADIAYFIRGVSKEYAMSNDTKWIVFGCGYAGTLAAWLRLKYPYLVHGAVSSSAPLLAKADFSEYYQELKSILDLHNPKCSSKIAEANEQLDRLIKTEKGRRHASRLFQLYTELENTPEDITSLFDALAENIAQVVQNNRGKRAASAVITEDPPTIQTICDIMTYAGVSALDLYAAVNIFIIKSYLWGWRNHSNKNRVERQKNTTYPYFYYGERQWNYQLCTEFGFYQTSSKSSDLFGAHIPSKYFTKSCEDVFGPEFNETRLNHGIYRTNTMYGGKKINVGNLVFVHGSNDPWKALGVTHVPKNAPYEIILINGTAHCGDIDPYEDGDKEELKEAQNKIKTILQSWLQSKK
ncbi:putative serine protease F56F10.1 isoform X2 [Planococcus citri]|uniref:putative serine protease F56F10.1 isoform X2 n=1 Tax=Planococcus citri TaxID=170843 RepID=UPI0031F8D07F